MTYVERPDLSFTKDPRWVKGREELWLQYCEGKYAELPRSVLKLRKELFFYGILDKPRDQGHGEKSFLRAIVNDFPLRSPDGWSYVVQEFGGHNDYEMQELLVYQVLSDLRCLGWSLKEELDLWDYFLPVTYNSTVYSQCVTKKHGIPVEGHLSLVKVVSQFLSGLSGIMRGVHDASPKYLYRNQLLISAIYEVNSETLKENALLNRKLNALFVKLNGLTSDAVNEYSEDLTSFLEEFSDAMRSSAVDSSVKGMWDNHSR